jgi:filamentous hemagglutinin
MVGGAALATGGAVGTAGSLGAATPVSGPAMVGGGLLFVNGGDNFITGARNLIFSVPAKTATETAISAGLTGAGIPKATADSIAAGINGGLMVAGGVATAGFKLTSCCNNPKLVITVESRSVQIDPNKFRYLFGDVTSDAHNAARSLQNAAQLNSIGIQNTEAGIQIITEQLTAAAQNPASFTGTILKTLPNGSVITLQTQDVLLSGPGGFLKLDVTWQVMSDGSLKFVTAIPH